MKKAEFEAIVERAKAAQEPEQIGDLKVVLICVDIMGQPANPDAIGGEVGVRFKARATAMVQASRDRTALLNFITQGFDVEWPEDREEKPTTPAQAESQAPSLQLAEIDDLCA